MGINLLICSYEKCLDNKIDISKIKESFEKHGCEVVVHHNFCEEAGKNLKIELFSSPQKPTVFAGCSPSVMEKKLKFLFDAPLEVANIREQCAWSCDNIKDATNLCKEIINLAVNQVKYCRKSGKRDNVLGNTIEEYVLLIENYGPNPFKM